MIGPVPDPIRDSSRNPAREKGEVLQQLFQVIIEKSNYKMFLINIFQNPKIHRLPISLNNLRSCDCLIRPLIGPSYQCTNKSYK